MTDSIRAHALLRCAQEIITNAIRHSGADNLWLTIERSRDGIVLSARDDGHGVEAVHPGTGLHERLEQIGGRLEIRSAPREGFHLEAHLPLTEMVS